MPENRRRIAADVNLQFHGWKRTGGNAMASGRTARRLISKLQFHSIWRAAAETAARESVTVVRVQLRRSDPINARNCVIRASSSAWLPSFCPSVCRSSTTSSTRLFSIHFCYLNEPNAIEPAGTLFETRTRNIGRHCRRGNFSVIPCTQRVSTTCGNFRASVLHRPTPRATRRFL